MRRFSSSRIGSPIRKHPKLDRAIGARLERIESSQRENNFVEPLEERTLFAATKIMPLGDSITEAEGGHASYRYWLWKSLTQAGFNDIDFVGSRTGVFNGSPQFSDFDQNHEGHWGWRADE